jgi:hypothetical protein
MSGLTDKGDGLPRRQPAEPAAANPALEQARQAWETSMEQQLERLRGSIAPRDPQQMAELCGAVFTGEHLELPFWGRPVRITWPELSALDAQSGAPCSTFDQALLLYYLHTATGTPRAGRWIGFRELPHGGFYNQAFQGYSGDRLGRAFHDQPAAFHQAARRAGGEPLPGLGEYAYEFIPLPRLALAVVLWPGDEDFPTRGQVLFDANASRYMITDGLALLGSGLVRRLERLASS